MEHYTDVSTGLTGEEVKERIELGLVNKTRVSSSKSLKDIILDNVCTYFNLVFTIIAVLLILVGSFRNLTFYIIVISNTLIGIIQELRSKKTLDRLQMLNAPKSVVRREGITQTVLSEELVRDDIVVFSAGNQICADAVVVSGRASVNEALITGESDEIVKEAGDRLLSGSFVVSGSCDAQLTNVGSESYISKLTIAAKQTRKGEQSEMIRDLNRLVKIVGIIIIPIGVILFSHQYFLLKNSVEVSVVGMVAAILGMIPEGLYLLASVALVVSVIRLAQKKVLVNDMKCIESLARVDVLCVDKTGTITENTMEVVGAEPVGSAPAGDGTSLEVLLSRFVSGMSGDNQTMQALKAYFNCSDGLMPDETCAFSSTAKYSSATFGDKCYVLGAPEFVLRDRYEAYRHQVEESASKGYRVLSFGLYSGKADGKPLTGDVSPIAFITLTNPIRKEARQTFEYFAEQGVTIKVISGDNPLTVTEVAGKAGIENADSFVDATTLVTEEDIYEAAEKYTIFGRVSPEQKRMLVRALKATGHTVAMTGDGVNDILALKDADCSVAMASGSDATAKAAQLVLLESDFSCMPSVVLEGRRVVNNIERSASLFLVKNIFSFLMSFFSVIIMVTYPLEPAQISLISMFTIGAPAFLLALEPNKERIKGHFLSSVVIRALPAGLTDFTVMSVFLVFCQIMGVSHPEASTACTIIMIVVGLLILIKISTPLDLYRGGTVLLMLIGTVAAAWVLGGLFGIRPLSSNTIILLCIFSVISVPVLILLSLLTDKIKDRVLRSRQ
ncbi:MAG: cation-translocating P-type ATPase [Lachnospiraceae bacterium]|nr:cation-translocating P-type ATPase [Lachnospiraceae bacterium]